MKFTIDNKLVLAYNRDIVKAQIAEFKACYTDGDLLRMFEEATDNWFNYNEIVYTKLDAFTGDYDDDSKSVNHYAVEMLLESYDKFIKINFYISQSGEVNTDWLKAIDNNGRWYDTDKKLWSVKTFKEV